MATLDKTACVQIIEDIRRQQLEARQREQQAAERIAQHVLDQVPEALRRRNMRIAVREYVPLAVGIVVSCLLKDATGVVWRSDPDGDVTRYDTPLEGLEKALAPHAPALPDLQRPV